MSSEITTLRAVVAQITAILARHDAPGAPACRESLHEIRLALDPVPSGLVERVTSVMEAEL
jgi:hypothetical protein